MTIVDSRSVALTWPVLAATIGTIRLDQNGSLCQTDDTNVGDR